MEATNISNYASAEVSGNYQNSSSSANPEANTSGLMKKNERQIFNQDNSTKMTGRSLSNNTIDLFQDKNETRILTNTTISNITSGSNVVASASSKVTGDFNGDGFEDKAIGVPFEDLDSPSGTITNAGVVHVIYGSPSGLSTSSVLPDQLLRQDSLDNGGIPEVNDMFGSSLSSGDFNGDGKDDLAIGVPGDDIDPSVATVGNFDAKTNSGQLRQFAGVVQVIYGSERGLSSAVLHNQVKVFIQGFDFLFDAPEFADFFGLSLASGDYNGDGLDDLAIGTPYEDTFLPSGGSVRDAGMVQVVYGSQLVGLDTNQAVHDQAFWQGNNHVIDAAESDDRFGLSLSSGDFNGDGKDDLAVGVPFERTENGLENPGTINVIYGSSLGLSTTSPIFNQVWEQGSGLADVPNNGDLFGSSLSSGDYNGDGKDDLAVGVPSESIAVEEGIGSREGAVNVIYGSSSGLSATGNQLWEQGHNGLHETAEINDFFGSSLSSSDFNGDGKDDLAVGVPLESVQGGTITFAGKVQVIYGSSSGLSATTPLADQLWEQGQNGLDDVAESGDGFGTSLSSGDFNGDGKADLSIGVPFESVQGGTIEDAGKVQVIYGSSSGLSATTPLADQLWEQGQNSLDDVSEAGDEFGWSQ